MYDATDEPQAGIEAEEPVAASEVTHDSQSATDAGGSSAGSMQAEQQQHSTATERASKASGKQVPAAKSLKRPQGTVATADGPAAGTATAAGPADTSDAGAAALAPAPPKTVKKPVTKTAADSSTEEAAAPGNEPTPPKHDAEEASVTAAMPKAAVKPKQPAVKTAAAKAAAKTAAAAAAADVVGMEQQEAHPAAAEESTGTDGAPPAAIAPAVAKPAAKKAASKAPSPAEQVADLAAGEAGNTEPAAPAAQASAAAKPAVVKKKPAKVSITGDAASISANSPAAAPSTHGSNPSRKGLHTLFGEGSTVSVLSQEGSEMPGSRPPAQLHAALDGHDHGQAAGSQMDDEEQEEIQKIISEIHGNGDESSGEDESEDQRLADIKHHLVQGAALPGSKRSSVVGAMPSSLMTQQQQTVDDLVVYEQSGMSLGGAGAAAEAGVDDGVATAADEQYSSQPAEQQEERASPLPGVTDIEQDPLAPDSSVEATPAVHTAAAAAYPSQHHAAPGLAEYSPEVYADAQAEGVMGMGPEGLMLAGSYDDLEGAGVEGDERSRAIAEQLAQLHEESRRLQLQSQVLQHRAIEMSLQMAVSSSTTAPDTLSSITNPAHQPHHLSGVGALPGIHQEQQGLAAGSSSMNSSQVLGGFSQVLTPDGLPLNPDTLGLVDGVLPRHPPGDSTPSSVTSSRAGLNWNIPSRGSIPSPGKTEAYSPAPGSPYLVSADAPRSGFNTIAAGYALHADPSLDYQMYSYHNNSQAAVNSNPEPGYALQQQQPPMQQHYMYQQQEQQQPQKQQQLQQQRPQLQYSVTSPAVASSAAPSELLSPTAALQRKRSFKTQVSGKSHNGQKAPPPLVVRRPTLPAKQGTGASTRVAAAGATAGRRSSCDNVGSYYGLVEETPAVGTFKAAHAVVGAQGKLAKAKQQEAIGKLSPRGAEAAAPAALKGAAAGTVSVAAAAAAATGKLAGSSSRLPAPVKSRSGSVSPSAGPTAAALAAAAAAAATSSGGHSHHVRAHGSPHSVAAGPWGPMPANPYAAAAAAAAMYGGGYGPVNPAMMPMMMMKGQLQGTMNAGSNQGIINKISPGRASGKGGMLGPEALAAMAAAVPPGGAWMPVGMPPGFMPVMPQGPMSAPGGKGLGPKGYGAGVTSAGGVQNPKKAAAGVVENYGKVRRGPGGAVSAPPGMQYGLPGLSPAAFMGMPGMPGVPYPAVGYPFGMNPQPAAMAASGRVGPAGKFLAAGPGVVNGRAGKGAVPAGYMPAGAGYVPAPAGYGAGAAAAWGPVMGPPGQFGMMPTYGPGAMAGLQQQAGKIGRGAAAGKGGWQAY